MSPGDYDDVLKSHMQSSLTSAIHARLRAAISGICLLPHVCLSLLYHLRTTGIEARGRRRTHKNLLTYEGKIDRTAILGVLASWVFNYNTVRQGW
jgi:hypothetical protein